MRVLVIDTALGLCTAGVFTVSDGEVTMLGLRSEAMVRGHSERLAGMARDAVFESGGGFSAIDRIGVTVGPGSFTGLRVGLAFAQGLGAALDRPVVGLSSLDALAASGEGEQAVLALIDARRGQVYGRVWRDGVASGPAEAWSLDQARKTVAELDMRPPNGAAKGFVLVGSGAPLLAEGLQNADVHPLEGPDPEALARLTAAADPNANPPRPLYLRAPDATPPTRLPGQARVPARP
ncbi:MAG: tRNA (adenosine(37)-N6)-threonylcarbamoyltransferase complex dimerization subunit type 1 TsaB [Alphaproteobacteria bacterium]|nr:MAG: tRNA (adenosine(37)-N6)-threonylcarbamoyltransferase complex dimerization subunit type 1 TsaB [Alphaproteobacteria bacterium]